MIRIRNRWFRWLAIALATLVASIGIATVSFAVTGVTPDQVLSAIEGTFGVNVGQRRNHIKGTCAVGNFVATAEAKTYSRSPLFSGKSIPVVARFSLAGGNPKAPDTAKNPRGLGLQFQLPNNRFLNMALINTPVFGVASPDGFYENMLAIRPDPATGKPDPEKVKAFREKYPENKAQATFLASNNPPTSYANTSYFGLHAFKFINQTNQTRLVRWQFVPQDGEKRLTDAELQAAPANFLEQKLIERTQQSPVKWDFWITLGQPGDAEDNPTIAWPSDRQQVKVGTLTLTAASPQPGAACEGINYDPLVLSDGIEPTNDPVLQFRSGVYALSYSKRSRGL
ncbi:catalase family peroxidase [Synechococcus elongatus]|uniref:catalase family peroxidase n=1 Tax=Synechococcus elongatus TaxID=32046 RepID=UPI0030CFE524